MIKFKNPTTTHIVVGGETIRAAELTKEKHLALCLRHPKLSDLFEVEDEAPVKKEAEKSKSKDKQKAEDDGRED